MPPLSAARLPRLRPRPDHALDLQLPRLQRRPSRAWPPSPAGGRIDRARVDEEIARLRRTWRSDDGIGGTGEALIVADLGPERAAELDRVDRVQLADVLAVCRASRTLSEAGRVLFAASRARRSSTNDADRLRKYLARFDLSFAALQAPDLAGG